jgi:hypothetical protein
MIPFIVLRNLAIRLTVLRILLTPGSKFNTKEIVRYVFSTGFHRSIELNQSTYSAQVGLE